jgi:hypothetical protein
MFTRLSSKRMNAPTLFCQVCRTIRSRWENVKMFRFTNCQTSSGTIRLLLGIRAVLMMFYCALCCINWSGLCRFQALTHVRLIGVHSTVMSNEFWMLVLFLPGTNLWLLSNGNRLSKSVLCWKVDWSFCVLFAVVCGASKVKLTSFDGNLLLVIAGYYLKNTRNQIPS